MNTDQKLLRLLVVKAMWPQIDRGVHKTELHLDAEIRKTLAEFDAEQVADNFCESCGVVDPTYKEDGSCNDCGEKKK